MIRGGTQSDKNVLTRPGRNKNGLTARLNNKHERKQTIPAFEARRSDQFAAKFQAPQADSGSLA